ncbi:MAG: hypothetical protein HOP37_07195 [Cyclobacteriaceae bacterium]|nr:hypothetical protein [Cyclobacteriaceae bacterium]
MRLPTPHPSFKIYDKINQFTKTFTLPDIAVNSVIADRCNFSAHYHSSFASSVAVPSLVVVPQVLLDQRTQIQTALDKLDWVYADNYIALYNGVNEKIKIATAELWNRWDHSDPALRIQALKAELKHRRQTFRGRYYQTLRALRDTLDETDFKKLVKEVSNRLESVRNLFSRLYGKIRVLSKAISLVNGSIDQGEVYRKKTKVIFKKSDDEDLNK